MAFHDWIIYLTIEYDSETLRIKAFFVLHEGLEVPEWPPPYLQNVLDALIVLAVDFNLVVGPGETG
jgi:hypothetical protein